MVTELKFSIVVPVFNRPEEIRVLLESLTRQQYRNFEVIIVEDGSDIRCKHQTDTFSAVLDLQYHFKPNTGPGHSRNFGASKATGDYLVFFDSDCLIPPEYLIRVSSYLKQHKLDVFGGPDQAHDSFSYVQKAINYSMTSFLTTGGIRGHKRASKSFQPRSFNMGISSFAFSKVEGFSDIHPGEDPELVYRLKAAGYSCGLIPGAFVYHKRRINFKSYAQQVYKFGIARVILLKWHPDPNPIVFYIPSLLLMALVIFIILGAIFNLLWWLLAFAAMVIFVDALRTTRSIGIALLAIISSAIQIVSYGFGFMIAVWWLNIVGKNERKFFRSMFFTGASGPVPYSPVGSNS